MAVSRRFVVSDPVASPRVGAETDESVEAEAEKERGEERRVFLRIAVAARERRVRRLQVRGR